MESRYVNRKLTKMLLSVLALKPGESKTLAKTRSHRLGSLVLTLLDLSVQVGSKSAKVEAAIKEQGQLSCVTKEFERFYSLFSLSLAKANWRVSCLKFMFIINVCLQYSAVRNLNCPSPSLRRCLCFVLMLLKSQRHCFLLIGRSL